jgi:hypothetical protein
VVGSTYTWGVSWREAGTPDGKVDVGERIDLQDQEFGLTVTKNLTYPDFSVSFRLFRLSFEMSLTHYVTFVGTSGVVVNQIVENYDSEGCQIIWN